MSTTLRLTLEHEECCNCGCVFGITKEKQQRLRDSGDWFYCPNGHTQHYSKSTVNKQKDEIVQLKRTAEYLRADVESQRDQKNAAHRSKNAFKGQVTKIKNRVANGVCPCCNRSFANLHRHMEKQHPDFNKD